MVQRSHVPLNVLLWDGHAKTNLIADFTGPYSYLVFGSRLHGGFKDLDISIAMPFTQAWEALNRENLPGYHFYHIEVQSDARIVWEGRVMRASLHIDRGFEGLRLKAFGYHSSLRDQYYDDDDSGNTNWAATSGGADDILKEMLTGECPDISSDQSKIEANTNDLNGITATATRDYVQNHLVDTLAPLTDDGATPWYWAIYENRIGIWKQRSVTTVDWFVSRSEIASLEVAQDATQLRNAIIPVQAGTEGTVATDTDSLALYPRRELLVTVPAGVSSGVLTDMRDTVLAERKKPRQSERIIIDGQMYSSHSTPDLAPVDGVRMALPKWFVRAGDVLRVNDLVPASITTSALDDLRTFFLQETRYDALTDTLTVWPDRPANDLSTLLARRIQIESDRI
jgi:hypothetical protein